MKKLYLIIYALFFAFCFSTSLNAQCGAFYDAFDGTANPLWVNQGNAHTLTFPTAGSQVGSNHLQLVGSSGHYNGMLATIPSSTPSNISYWAKAGSASAHDGYLTFGDGNLGGGSNSGVSFIYFQANTGNLRVLGSGTPSEVNVPYTPNTWFFIELRNIDWTNKTFDVWINNTQYSTIGFWSTAVNSVERVHIYNLNASTSWYDDIIIGGNPITSSFVAVDPSCNGDSTGMATFNATGGTNPINYVWSTGDTSNSISNLPAGSYSVSVTDSVGCVVLDTVTLVDPPALVTSVSATQITCPGGSDGSIDLTASGGMAPLTYQWNNGDTAQDLSGLNFGVYSVITTDSNGCTSLDTANITAPAAFASGLTVTDISCNGEIDGEVGVNVSGGTAPYTYMWSTGDSVAALTGLAAGSYSVTVMDTNGCTFADSGTVTEPTALTNSGAVTDETNGQSDGSIDITASGGTPALTFDWTGPNGYTSTNEDPTGLAAGEYIVTITDENGCVLNDTFQVNNFVGIEGELEAGQIAVYPNPFVNTLTLALGANQVENLEYQLMDLTGRVIFSETLSEVAGGFSKEFNLEDQSAGMYLLEVRADNQRQLFQVVKQ